eukprot:TRINITY_DN2530_c0_g2_i3.p1 TRINITY_DN2530_c0_g2~~TRINITY_DN2530_c0_g2_i3.p1  ORF type:complete len:928 (+),score=137.08 TRINITY_DN2530_c0_g2_i3:75-2858(+)
MACGAFLAVCLLWLQTVVAASMQHAKGSYVGGNGAEIAESSWLDTQGNLYVIGTTASTTWSAAGSNPNKGGKDAFYAKLNSNMSAGWAPSWVKYLGGSGEDQGQAITGNTNGYIYVAGSTMSPNFPRQTSHGSLVNKNIFISRISPLTGSVTHSTLIGGSGVEDVAAIAIDTSNNAYVVGTTTSGNWPSVARSNKPGNIFLVKIVDNSVLYSFKFGSNEQVSGGEDEDDEGLPTTIIDLWDYATSVLWHVQSNSVWVGGYTTSNNFETLAATRNSLQGQSDGFLVKFSYSSFIMQYSSYFGGTKEDYINDLAADDTNIYACGNTKSTSIPNLTGGTKGPSDAFYAVINAGSNIVSRGAIFGGNGDESALSIAVNNEKEVYVAGSIQGSTSQFPFLNQAYSSPNVGFIMKYSTAGVQQLGSFIGLDASSLLSEMSLLRTNRDNLIFVGKTGPLPLEFLNGAIQSTIGGAEDGFIQYYAIYDSPLTTSPLTTKPLTTARLTTKPLTTAPLTTKPLTTNKLTTGVLTTSPLTTGIFSGCSKTCWDGECVGDFSECSTFTACTELSRNCGNLTCLPFYEMCADRICSSEDVVCADGQCAPSLELCVDYNGCPFNHVRCPDGLCTTDAGQCRCGNSALYRCFDGSCTADPSECTAAPYTIKPLEQTTDINLTDANERALPILSSTTSEQICTVTFPEISERKLVVRVEAVPDSELIEDSSIVELNILSAVFSMEIGLQDLQGNEISLTSVGAQTIRVSCDVASHPDDDKYGTCLAVFDENSQAWSCTRDSSDRSGKSTGQTVTMTARTSLAFLLDTSDRQGSSSDDSLPASYVIGAVCAAIGLVIIGMIVVVIVMRRRRRDVLASVRSRASGRKSGTDSQREETNIKCVRSSTAVAGVKHGQCLCSDCAKTSLQAPSVSLTRRTSKEGTELP